MLFFDAQKRADLLDIYVNLSDYDFINLLEINQIVQK